MTREDRRNHSKNRAVHPHRQELSEAHANVFRVNTPDEGSEAKVSSGAHAAACSSTSPKPGFLSKVSYATTLAARPDVVVLDVELQDEVAAQLLTEFIRDEAAAIQCDGTNVHVVLPSSTRHYSSQRGAAKWVDQACSALDIPARRIISTRRVSTESPRVVDQFGTDRQRWGLDREPCRLDRPWIGLDERRFRRLAEPMSMALLVLSAAFAVSAGSCMKDFSTVPAPHPWLVVGTVVSTIITTVAFAWSTGSRPTRSTVLVTLAILATGVGGFLFLGMRLPSPISLWRTLALLATALAVCGLALFLASLALRAVRSSFVRGLAGLSLLAIPIVFVTRALTRGIASGLGMGGIELGLRGDLVAANFAGTISLLLVIGVAYIWVIVKGAPTLGHSLSLVFIMLTIAVLTTAGWSTLSKESNALGARIRHGDLASTHGLAHLVCLSEGSAEMRSHPYVLVGNGGPGSAYFRFEKVLAVPGQNVGDTGR